LEFESLVLERNPPFGDADSFKRAFAPHQGSKTVPQGRVSLELNERKFLSPALVYQAILE